MSQLVTLHEVSKVYPGGREALTGVSLTLAEGEAVALIGTNGSGKSTLLKVLAGLTSHTTGRMDFHRRHPRIGYVPERVPMRLRFTALEYLMHMGLIEGLNRAELSVRVGDLLERYGLGGAAGVPISKMSKGMRQKVGIIQAVLCPPDILLLDEPTSGLDAPARDEMVDMLRRMATGGVTMLFSTHDPGLADGLAVRCIELAGGIVVADTRLSPVHVQGSPTTAEDTQVVRLALPEGFPVDELLRIPGVSLLGTQRPDLTLSVGPAQRDALLLTALRSGCAVLSVSSSGGIGSEGVMN